MNRSGRSSLRALALGLAIVAPTAAVAQTAEQAVVVPRPDVVQGSVGVRSMLIRSAGYDPFSGTDVLPQLSLAIAHPLVRHDAFGFAAGVGLDYGETISDARSAASSLSVLRLSAIAEARYYPLPYAYGFARFAPGLLRAAAALVDASSPNAQKLEDRFDVLSLDASAGAAVRLSGAASRVGAWIGGEGGYGWAQSHHLLLAPRAAARDQAKLAPVDLGTIDPRGAFFRLSLAITY